MAKSATLATPARPSAPRLAAIPPHAFFLVSALFHYLGPAFAVLLFGQVSVLGVAWLRIAGAALVFALWRRPWRAIVGRPRAERRTLLALGVVLAAMNACFYLAIDRLPLATVGAIEFLGPIALAAVGLASRRNALAAVGLASRRNALAAVGLASRRNALALGLAVVGVWLLTDFRLAGEPLGFLLAFANCALFVLYVVLGHRVAQDGAGGIDRLGAAMLVALLAITPVGLLAAAPTFTRPPLLLAGLAVGICSSVIPYVCDQVAMARLPRASFALLLALLPACATLIGLLVLGQRPHPAELAGIALVVAAVAAHRPPREEGASDAA